MGLWQVANIIVNVWNLNLNSKLEFKFLFQLKFRGESRRWGCDRLRRGADVEADTISQRCSAYNQPTAIKYEHKYISNYNYKYANRYNYKYTNFLELVS